MGTPPIAKRDQRGGKQNDRTRKSGGLRPTRRVLAVSSERSASIPLIVSSTIHGAGQF